MTRQTSDEYIHFQIRENVASWQKTNFVSSLSHCFDLSYHLLMKLENWCEIP